MHFVSLFTPERHRPVCFDVHANMVASNSVKQTLSFAFEGSRMLIKTKKKRKTIVIFGIYILLDLQ